VDYAGLANDYLKEFGKDLGTTTTGMIIERRLSDGRAEDTVLLTTNNALTWVIQGCADFATQPLLFGHRVTDILAGQDAAVGDSFSR